MKRVLIAAPFTKGDLFNQRFVTPPLGVWRIASYLRYHDIECDVYDCNDPDSVSFEIVLEQVKYDIIAFSVLTATLEYDLAAIHKAKKLQPDAMIVAGGSGAALEYQRVLDNAPVDVIVTAEGEYPMLELAKGNGIGSIDGIISRTYAKVLTSEDYWEISQCLDYEAMGAERYWKKTATLYDEPDYNEINTFRLFTSNYCPMGCKFCTLTLWRKYASGCNAPVVSLSPDEVVSQIMDVVDAYPDVRQIFFVDDDFFLLNSRTEPMLEAIVEAKKNETIPERLRFICLTNINRITEYRVKLMAAAGFRILSIGVESTSQDVLDSLNKKQTVEQIWENTQLILDAGIKPYYTLLLFTPYCTLDDLVTQIIDYRKMSEMGAGLSLEPYLIPLPGTPLHEARVPESTREVAIDGTGKTITKGFAWLPTLPVPREIFDEYERIYPRYKKLRNDKDGVKHKEKNYAAHIMLDCLELVLSHKFDVRVPNGRFDNYDAMVVFDTIEEMPQINVDIVGDFTEDEGFSH